ncbi:hypothetical protein ACU8KH_05867 [Lachancea thermotolerans]
MQHETLESGSPPISYLKDLKNGNEVLIVEGDIVHLYRTKDSSFDTSRVTELKNSALHISFRLVNPKSDFFLVLAFDLSITVFDIPGFKKVAKKRLKINEQDVDPRKTLRFLDSDSEQLYFSLNEKQLVSINKSDLLSESPFAKFISVHDTPYRIENAFCLNPNKGFFCLAKRDLIQNVLAFEVIHANTFRHRNNHSRYGRLLQEYTAALDCGSSGELGTLVEMITLEAPKTVVFLFSRGVIIFNNKVCVFENKYDENTRESLCLDGLIPGASLYQGEEGLRLSILSTKGETISTTIDLRKPKSLQWNSVTLNSFLKTPLDSMLCYKCLGHGQILLISKREGMVFADYQKERILYISRYKRPTYLDALPLDFGFARATTVVACGGYNSTLGFISFFQKSVSANTFKVIEFKHFGATRAIRDFWFTTKGIVSASSIRGSDKFLLHVSFHNKTLTRPSTRCALQLKNVGDEYIILDNELDLYLVKGKTTFKLASMAKLSSWNVCYMSAFQGSGSSSSLFIAISDGKDVYMLENGVIVAEYSFEDANINDICLKDCSSSKGTVLIVTNRAGCVTILNFSFETHSLSISLQVCLGENRAFRLCDIKMVESGTTEHQDSAFFVYSSSKVFVFNLSRRCFYKWIPKFDIKLIKYQGNSKYVVLTMDDSFVTLTYSGALSAEWTTEELVSKDWVYTKMVQLRNPRYILLASQTTNFKSKVSIFDTESLNTIDEYALPDQGVIKGVIALEKPYAQEILISFAGCSPESDCLLVLSALRNKLFKSGTYKTRGASAALTQRGETIACLGTTVLLFKLQRRLKKREWDFKLLMRPFEGSGPWSVDCAFVSEEILCVLDRAKGICFFDLATKTPSLKCSIQSLAPDFANDRGHFDLLFSTLIEDTKQSEFYKINGPRTAKIRPLLDPIEKTARQLSIVVACGSQLLVYPCHPRYFKNSQNHSKCNLPCASGRIPFEDVVMSTKRTDANQFLVCTAGRLLITSLDT